MRADGFEIVERLGIEAAKHAERPEVAVATLAQGSDW
jgi:hypothetical protein